ncbi:MAG: MBOAT family protein [Lachnospiraceae bacterium]|nr:MBOAT family protein [Lachnospiraceae bacterium]
MVFSGITFLIYFLPPLLLLYHLLPKAARQPLLLAASLLFYAWGEPKYLVLMVVSILMNYVFGLLMGKARAVGIPERTLKLHLGIMVALDLSLLIFFKYTDMFLHWGNVIFHTKTPLLDLALPIGISFYTFQALSYVIDVYRGNVSPQRNLMKFALYISMFPQLIAGPIVRYADLEPQLTLRDVSSSELMDGLAGFAKGLIKKVLLANAFGAMFELVKGAPGPVSLASAWLGAIAFTLQIYFDFSGYSDMAISLGHLFGYTFPENFDHPYTAVSVTDFWRKWHISLGTWFREYVYIPLGGNRVGTLRHIFNLLAVWMLTGLWHGAAFNFLLWGLYYGIWLILEKYLILPGLGGNASEKNRRKIAGAGNTATAATATAAGERGRLISVIGRLYTIPVIIIGWVLFAFTDPAELGSYLLSMVGAGGLADHFSLTVFLQYAVMLALGILCSTRLPGKLYNGLKKNRPVILAILLLIGVILSVAAITYDSYNPFLYFRF